MHLASLLVFLGALLIPKLRPESPKWRHTSKHGTFFCKVELTCFRDPFRSDPGHHFAWFGVDFAMKFHGFGSRQKTFPSFLASLMGWNSIVTQSDTLRMGGRSFFFDQLATYSSGKYFASAPLADLGFSSSQINSMWDECCQKGRRAGADETIAKQLMCC